MDAVFNGFFSLLNQLILLVLSLAVPGRELGWFNVPFATLLVLINGAAIYRWQRQGARSAWGFYAFTNVRCFVGLCVAGLLISAVAVGASRFHW